MSLDKFYKIVKENSEMCSVCEEAPCVCEEKVDESLSATSLLTGVELTPVKSMMHGTKFDVKFQGKLMGCVWKEENGEWGGQDYKTQQPIVAGSYKVDAINNLLQLHGIDAQQNEKGMIGERIEEECELCEQMPCVCKEVTSEMTLQAGGQEVTERHHGPGEQEYEKEYPTKETPNSQMLALGLTFADAKPGPNNMFEPGDTFVMYKGKKIGFIWGKEGNWEGEETSTGMSWAGYTTKEEAAKHLLQHYLVSKADKRRMSRDSGARWDANGSYDETNGEFNQQGKHVGKYKVKEAVESYDDEGGAYGKCVSCGEELFLDPQTEMCVDCTEAHNEAAADFGNDQNFNNDRYNAQGRMSDNGAYDAGGHVVDTDRYFAASDRLEEEMEEKCPDCGNLESECDCDLNAIKYNAHGKVSGHGAYDAGNHLVDPERAQLDAERKMNEEHMTQAEKDKKEDTVIAMKKDAAGFKERYGKRWKEVMNATATKQAMKEGTKVLEDVDAQSHDQATTASFYGFKEIPKMSNPSMTYFRGPKNQCLMLFKGKNAGSWQYMAEPGGNYETDSGNLAYFLSHKGLRSVQQADEGTDFTGMYEDTSEPAMSYNPTTMAFAPITPSAPMDTPADTEKKLSVNTNFDAATGIKTVTVSAEGESAEELERMLASAGLNQAPAVNLAGPEIAVAEADQAPINQPKPITYDYDRILKDQGDDLHKPASDPEHSNPGAFNRDNPRMGGRELREGTVVLADKLLREFNMLKTSATPEVEQALKDKGFKEYNGRFVKAGVGTVNINPDGHWQHSNRGEVIKKGDDTASLLKHVGSNHGSVSYLSSLAESKKVEKKDDEKSDKKGFKPFEKKTDKKDAKKADKKEDKKADKKGFKPFEKKNKVTEAANIAASFSLRWFDDYHEIEHTATQKAIELNLEDYGFVYSGPEGGLKYPGLYWNKRSSKPGKGQIQKFLDSKKSLHGYVKPSKTKVAEAFDPQVAVGDLTGNRNETASIEVMLHNHGFQLDKNIGGANRFVRKNVDVMVTPTGWKLTQYEKNQPTVAKAKRVGATEDELQAVLTNELKIKNLSAPKQYTAKNAPSCWGCGSDYLNRWRPEDMGNYKGHKICPDCLGEVEPYNEMKEALIPNKQ